MEEKPLLYFKNQQQWREWLLEYHLFSRGVYLVFHKVDSGLESMRWEEAVQVAICFGWIDSTVKKIDATSRKQSFSPRNNKSVWSKLNKTYINHLIDKNLMHESGLRSIEIAKQNGSWEALDAVENLEIPNDLAEAFEKNQQAYDNYKKFSPSYRKSYLYWLNQAKKSITRAIRIAEIVENCERNIKYRGGF